MQKEKKPNKRKSHKNKIKFPGLRQLKSLSSFFTKSKKKNPSDGHKLNKKLKKLKNRLFLPQFLREMKKLCIGGISGGNSLKLISAGDICFQEIFAALRSAESSINLETYIFNSDEVGWEVCNLLVEKSKLGVEVNVIYDAVGCIATASAMFDYLKEAGVEVIEYHPILPWRKYWNLSLRDHRKILVVDGRTAFLGGINIGNEYAGEKYDGGNWRDTHMKIEGPAVNEIQFFFMENWFRNSGAIVDYNRHFSELPEIDNTLVMILCSKSRKNVRPIRESYLSAIKYARHSIYITNAYFIPDPKVYRALFRAAQRGVDVRILLPNESDIQIVKFASRYLYKRYLKHGIKVYEYNRSVLHAKTAVIDGIWSTVGSSNIDRRSFKKNLEINAVILDQNFGEEMEAVFLDDLKSSVEITLEKWEKRHIWYYIVEWLCYRFRNYL